MGPSQNQNLSFKKERKGVKFKKIVSSKKEKEKILDWGT